MSARAWLGGEVSTIDAMARNTVEVIHGNVDQSISVRPLMGRWSLINTDSSFGGVGRLFLFVP